MKIAHSLPTHAKVRFLSIGLITITLLGFATTLSAQEITSENNKKLKAALEKYPEADANKDGVLTLSEAQAFQNANQREGSGSDAATTRTPSANTKKGDKSDLAINIPPELEQEIIEGYPEMDINGDQKISLEELNEKGDKSARKKHGISGDLSGKIQAVVNRNNYLEKLAQSVAGTKKKMKALGYEVEFGIKYKDSGQDTTYIDFVYPKKKVYKRAPVFFYVHGGAYRTGTRGNVFGESLEAVVSQLSENGIAVATIGYRLTGKLDDVRMTDLSEDIQDALRYMAKHRDTYGIDPERFITMGKSAGSSLALLSALCPHDHLPGAVMGPGTQHTVIGNVSFFGGTTFSAPEVIGSSTDNSTKNSLFPPKGDLSTEEIVRLTSPDLFFTSDSPPILVFSGEYDGDLVKHGRYLKKLGQKTGVEVTYHEIKNAGHGFGDSTAHGELSMTNDEANAIVVEHILRWVKVSQ